MEKQLRVLVGEDHPLIRAGLVSVLSRGGFDVIAAVENATELLKLTQEKLPDVVVTDIQMPPRMLDDGLAVAVQIRETLPEIAVIVLSQFLEDQYVLDLIGDRPEGVGYLLKEKIADADLLVDAVHRVAEGGTALDRDVITSLTGRRKSSASFGTLTPRERDVLALMAEGHSNLGIANRLHVGTPAVERHISGIFAKLGLFSDDSEQHRRVLAVLKFLQE